MKKSEGPDLKKQVFVVGAGASGLMAAIQAAVYGAAVTVLEQNDRPGRKICATGNGRCNMTNLNQDEIFYWGDLRAAPFCVCCSRGAPNGQKVAASWQLGTCF